MRLRNRVYYFGSAYSTCSYFSLNRCWCMCFMGATQSNNTCPPKECVRSSRDCVRELREIVAQMHQERANDGDDVACTAELDAFIDKFMADAASVLNEIDSEQNVQERNQCSQQCQTQLDTASKLARRSDLLQKYVVFLLSPNLERTQMANVKPHIYCKMIDMAPMFTLN